ncbi:MAG: GNAT family N-acetyltransferase [Clostridia bacterium]|nr:GNAT family N-acetyltransferase [Clostridia bacterium]
MVDNKFNGYKIREITPADNASVASIVRYNLKQRGLDIPGTAYFDSCLNDLWAFYSGRDCCGYYVLTDENGAVVGGIGFDKINGIENGAELQKMYLADSAKGKGLSYFLIGFIEEKMRENGIKTSYLETHTNLNIAIHVYEKCGYRRIERPADVGHSTMDHFFIKDL